MHKATSQFSGEAPFQGLRVGLMQGRRFEGTYELNSFNADPTQPTYPTYLRAEGLPGAGGPAIGSTGSQPLSKQGFFPPAPIYPDTRLLAASSYHGLSNNQQVQLCLFQPRVVGDQSQREVTKHPSLF